MIECPKCGKSLFDDMKYCGYCGSPLVELSVENAEIKKKKGINKPLLFSMVGLILAGIIGAGIFFNSDYYKYSNAEKALNAKNYTLAAEILGDIRDYKDADSLYSLSMYENAKQLMSSGQYETAQAFLAEIPNYEDSATLHNDCTHMIAIQNDVTAPVIKGMESGAVIEAKYEEEFNLMNYLHKTISVSDDVSGEITEFIVTSTSDAYNTATGDVDTENAGTHNFSLSVLDEAGNKSSVDFSIEIDNTIYISKDNPNPVLCDNEKFGIYTLKSLYHGYKDGVNGYIMEIDIENKYANAVYSYIGACYINDYKVQGYFNIGSIASDKKGTMRCYIYDDDLDDNTSEFDYIEATFVIKRFEHGLAAMDETIFSRPVIISKDAFV